jgi:hypothetical protein
VKEEEEEKKQSLVVVFFQELIVKHAHYSRCVEEQIFPIKLEKKSLSTCRTAHCCSVIIKEKKKNYPSFEMPNLCPRMLSLPLGLCHRFR